MTSAASFPANSTPKLADPSRSARPRLSVVVLSCEKAAGLAGTLPTLLDALRVMEAELVVVRTVEAAGDDDLGLQALARVIIAGPGATRSECVDLGMSMVRGDIVLVRDDAQLRELDWLRPLARVVG